MFRTQSGYAGVDIGEYRQPGSNGLALDARGPAHDQRARQPPRQSRLERTAASPCSRTAIEGKRLNSPNDLVYRSDGALFFTDPPFGLPKVFDDPRKELPFSGVYAVVERQRCACSTPELTGPNGIAFSPDERYLYVGNWDEQKKVVMRYDVARDGHAVERPRVLRHDQAPGEDAIDGIKVDVSGNALRLGPGRPLDHLARRQAPRHDRRARATSTTWPGATTTAGRSICCARDRCIGCG